MDYISIIRIFVMPLKYRISTKNYVLIIVFIDESITAIRATDLKSKLNF